MKLSATILAVFTTGAAAFQPAKAPSSSSKTALDAASLNGWTPDANKFAYGLPGSLDPVPEFDPLGFAANADLD